MKKNKQTNETGAGSARSDTRLNRRSLIGYPPSSASLASRSSSISEVDFCELDETDDVLAELDAHLHAPSGTS